MALALLDKASLKAGVLDDGLLSYNRQKKEIDLILMDIQMPTMDGFTVTEKIRNELELKDVPIMQ